MVIYCISRSFIQHNLFVEDLWKKSPVRNLWFPNSPSKEFCLQLLRGSAPFGKEIALLSVMNNWLDVFQLCAPSCQNDFDVKCLIYRLGRVFLLSIPILYARISIRVDY
jgi:hypothetical protein